MLTLQYLRAKYLALYVLKLAVMPSDFTRHPAKGIYSASFLAFLPLRLLYSLTYYLPSKLRPHPEWTIQQSVGTFALKALYAMLTKIEYHPPKTPEPGSDGKRFITIPPRQAQHLRRRRDRSARQTSRHRGYVAPQGPLSTKQLQNNPLLP